MELKEKIKIVFADNIIIAKQLGNGDVVSIIEGIEKEVLDAVSEVSE